MSAIRPPPPPPTKAAWASSESPGSVAVLLFLRAIAFKFSSSRLYIPSSVFMSPARKISAVVVPGRDRPELADKPVAVGGESMISTTNYHARKWGVRSAMPGFIGRRLCPELVFVPPDFEK